MKIIYKRPIKEEIDKGIAEAKATGKTINFIILDGKELNELVEYCSKSLDYAYDMSVVGDKIIYNGVEIRKVHRHV